MTQKKHTPLIAVRAVQPVMAGLDALGYETDRIFAKVNISRAVLDNADGGIPHPTMMAFWQEALAVTGDGHLGLHLAEAAPLESFGVHAYALQSSPTLREAYRRACRYQRLIHEATDLTFDEEVNEGVLQHALPGGRSVPRHPAEFLVTLWVRFGRLITGRNWAPRLVCFAHNAPPDVTEHQRVFQTPIQFLSGRTAMHIPNHILDTANASADPGLIGVLDDYAERLLQQMPVSTAATLSERVRFQLLETLTGGIPTAEEIAQSLHMSVRTLHRNLQQEGVTFSKLLNQLRQEQATSYLTNPNISISEVAFLLGFSEISSFYRAFKRWTGTTPAEFRAEKLPNFTPPHQSQN
jgi:AraC-like DNA-binding protein